MRISITRTVYNRRNGGTGDHAAIGRGCKPVARGTHSVADAKKQLAHPASQCGPIPVANADAAQASREGTDAAHHVTAPGLSGEPPLGVTPWVNSLDANTWTTMISLPIVALAHRIGLIDACVSRPAGAAAPPSSSNSSAVSGRQSNRRLSVIYPPKSN